MKRKRMSRGKSKREFRKAAGTKKVNLAPPPQRGGWRF